MIIGLAERAIKTPLGMQMTGYAGRIYGAIHVHDPLKMSALYLESKNVRSLLITCQLLGFDPSFSKETEHLIAKATGVPFEHIIISCTHTHAGPASGTLFGCGTADPAWLESTRNDLIECAKSAVLNHFDGRMEVQTGTASVAINRIALAHKMENYESLIDPEVGIIRFIEQKTDTLKALYINYACHPVTLDAKNHEYSADYHYYAIKELQAHFGRDVAVILSTGCCGDLNPKYRFGYDMSEKTGRLLAQTVIDAKSSFVQTEPKMSFTGLSMKIPLVASCAIDELPIRKKQGREAFIRLTEEDYVKNAMSARLEGVTVEWADHLIRQHKEGMDLHNIFPLIKTARIGELTLIGLPFEPFHQLGLEYKTLVGHGKTFVLGYTGGVFGYLPYGELYDHANYEAKTAYRYYGYIGPVHKDTGNMILEKLKTIL